MPAAGRLGVDARMVGGAAGAVAVWRRAPFIVVVLVAMAARAGAIQHQESTLFENGLELEQIKVICESGLYERFNYANKLAAQFFRDRESTKELLYLWLRWWRDLILIKECAEEYVQNPDEIVRLRLQATQLSTPQIIGFVKSLNFTLEALDSNANARLALEVLMLNLPGVNIRV